MWPRLDTVWKVSSQTSSLSHCTLALQCIKPNANISILAALILFSKCLPWLPPTYLLTCTKENSTGATSNVIAFESNKSYVINAEAFIMENKTCGLHGSAGKHIRQPPVNRVHSLETMDSWQNLEPFIAANKRGGLIGWRIKIPWATPLAPLRGFTPFR